ncbi:unnamed protein product [Strongylus vulgaris]|uniref:Uncharacterized protein n=1 Tax=Strongylus vulgaris TaxID=40348 RepID=A0A3P7LS93_STRVU|nr:unnamed protein product [Strongylus vulgaris]
MAETKAAEAASSFTRDDSAFHPMSEPTQVTFPLNFTHPHYAGYICFIS